MTISTTERTVRFIRVLGLEEIRRHKSPRGSELVFLKTPGSEEQIEITCFPGSGPCRVQPDLTHLAFEVDNLEEFGKHLASLGLKFSDGPTKSSSGSVFAFVDAPEGYEIEFIELPGVIGQRRILTLSVVGTARLRRPRHLRQRNEHESRAADTDDLICIRRNFVV